MNTNSPVRLLAGLFLYLAVAPLAFGLPDVNSVARLVDERYNRLQTLEADFTEIYQGSGTERIESGKLWLKKPGKMRWEYRSPEEKLFVADGRNGWLYLPAQQQARKSSMKTLDDIRSPLALLLGKTRLEKELTGLAFAPDVKPWRPDDVILRGAPRGLEDRIRQILLEVSVEHRIVRILIQGADDSITEYRFSDQKENVPVANAQFRFVPPSGTEVIEDEMEN
ncbi:MAG TPA: outer membrane lipoprotein chaperone LolA [Terriglobales bacterium]|nr:outer membrane lipoprotein chaperone LolA [Terriglobales bacterium]